MSDTTFTHQELKIIHFALDALGAVMLSDLRAALGLGRPSFTPGDWAQATEKVGKALADQNIALDPADQWEVKLYPDGVSFTGPTEATMQVDKVTFNGPKSREKARAVSRVFRAHMREQGAIVDEDKRDDLPN